jgi:transposase InsO family protein
VCIISDKLRKRLRLVATPWRGGNFCGADSLSFSQSPCGFCTIRFSLSASTFVVQAVIFSSCVSDFIIGDDFLKEHGALIDYHQQILELPFASDLNGYRDVEASVKSTPALIRHTVLSPSSFTTIACRIASNIPDGTTLLLTPRRFPETHLTFPFPYAISTTLHNVCYVQLHNPHSTEIVLPEGFHLYDAEICLDDAIVATLTQNTQIASTRTDQTVTTELSHEQLRQMIDKELPPLEFDELSTLLQEYATSFDCNTSTLGRAVHTFHAINVGDNTPIRQRLRRHSPEEREVISKEVQSMLSKGVIEQSSSPWASPVVLVRKKDNTWRFCIDFRKVNGITKKDSYPLPRIDDALDTLYGSSYFSSIDLRSGYWQIPMKPDDKEKTAFLTPDGLYHFNVMPFGLCNAPATFERLMDNVLRGLTWQICLCYLDDVLVFASSFAQHLSRLRLVLQALAQAGLQLNAKKCHFGARSVKVLGHIVNSHGIKPDPDKIKAVSEFPVPKDVKELQSFLGLCGHFRRFIARFADRAHSLTQLLAKKSPWVWTNTSQCAFDDLKQALSTPPVLAHYNPNATIELHTDASSFGLGAVLLQPDCESLVLRPVAYASRTLSPAERNYSTTERECLAIVWAVTKFRPYVYGKHFNVITDHHSLCWLANLQNPSGRLARWSLRLQEYDFTIAYKSGDRHKDADGLSRRPLASENSSSIDTVSAVLEIRSTADLKTLQQNDSFCGPIIDFLQHMGSSAGQVNRKQKTWQNIYKLREGLLFRTNFFHQGRDYLLVLPASLRAVVLDFYHDDPSSGHLGFAKTYHRIASRFYWPRMSRHVTHHVRSCDLCQRRKSGSSSTGALQSIRPPRQPFECVGIDFLGPFPKSSDGNQYIIVSVDYLTRYAETRSVRHANAEAAAKFFLEQIVLRHGSPLYVISDRGKAFLSKVFSEVLRHCASVHHKTTAYHPQSNGLTERLNHTLADMLSMYVNSTHTNWDVVLPFVTFAYNTSLQASSHYTPFSLVYARDVTTPLDALFSYALNSDSRTNAIFTAAQEARQLARSAIMRSQKLQELRYNASHSPVTFAVGEFVWIRFPTRQVGLAEKLLRKFHGPFRILRRVGPVNYEVQRVSPTDGSSPQRDIVHVSRLKKFFSRSKI